ncbi:hypothetical protein A8C56_11605 [Niabella ginsenosidivorans]|uniref:Uncharacterized protein n=1 Tax=Niabella ginsenosidivorans TaxID=1176587 RepID=A0A1A9I4Q1_9BACT|nr:hypothetical protein [Niabella ginsenosidivorans]ANH81534.1 hypothetical protein A8C56_11605 [Niabella ginsenosidivorans]
MQRIEALIEKLRTQFNNKAELSQLLITTQMIQREISGAMKETAVLGSTNVAVLMPNMPSLNKRVVVKDAAGMEKEYFSLGGINEDEVDEEEFRILKLQYDAGLYMDEEEDENKHEGKNEIKNGKDIKSKDFDPLIEVPTLFQQVKNGRTGGTVKTEQTVDDGIRPKSPQVIHDLTKDISEADKERFVKNLFRGDEVMYNRCIKTINNFNSLEQAEYWVTRELKTKLGWINNSDVEYFDRLIYRRFASI